MVMTPLGEEGAGFAGLRNRRLRRLVRHKLDRTNQTDAARLPDERMGGEAMQPLEKRLAHVGGVRDEVALLRFVRELKMDAVHTMGADEAHKQFPALVDAAEEGQTTIISRDGRPIAALVPIAALAGFARQQSLLPLAGSGRGLWGLDRSRSIDRLRDEWGA